MPESELVGWVVQGGFGALVALFVWQSFRREDRMATRMNQVEDRSAAALENNTKAMNELVFTLRERPCLFEKAEGRGKGL